MRLLILTSEFFDMAVRASGVWGIDLGQSALKAIRLEMKDGHVEATAFEYIEHPKILSQPDADPDELAREALNQFLSRNQIRGDIIAISVPGQSGLARFVKLPPVDEKKIADIVKFEAKQQIPFPLEEVVWDYQRLNKGDIVDGLALETEIGLFAMKRDMVIRSIAQFKGVNVEVHLVQMAPLALCNFIAYDLLGKAASDLAEGDQTHDCIVALEIGTDSSNLVITDGGRIIWQRPIPIGGNHFTRALTKEMKLTFAKAEHLKKNAAKSPELKKILSSLKQVLNDFVGEVQRSLGYFTNTHRNAQIQYMVGLGNAFRLPGLQKFLQEKLQLEVRKFQKLARATGESVTSAPTFAENIMTFGVAYGLALQGLKQAHLQTNLLPYEVRLERVIRGKKPWAVAAAACLIFGMCMLALAQGQEKRAVLNDTNTKKQKELEAIVKTAKDNDEKVEATKKDRDNSVKSLIRIGAGANDRVNWQLLHQYVNGASPRPDGGRVALQAGDRIKRIKDILWDQHAQWAFRLFEQKKVGELKDIPKEEADKIDQFFKLNKIPINFRQPKDLSPADAEEVDRFIKQNLIQINIAGVNVLYTEDLGPYFRLIREDVPLLRGMADVEKKHINDFVGESDETKRNELPLIKKGKDGWVVEIRGYTYHKGGESFVQDTIIENLKYPGQLEEKKDKEMIERIKRNVSYLFIYESGKAGPGAGQSKIAKSHLRRLVRGIAEAGPDGKVDGPGLNPRPGRGKEGDGGVNAPANQKANREAWNPIGETAIAVLVNDAGGAFGAPPGKWLPGEKIIAPPLPGGDPKTAAQDKAMERIEFVLLFVWREPIASAKPSPAVEK
jgi:type IV pilus assembly protein PilM